MKKTKLFIALPILAFCVNAGFAADFSDYVESFDGLDVSKHDFAPVGWGHIVDSYYDYDYYDTYYVDYANPSTGGYDGGAYLSIGSQELGAYWTTEVVDDMLVTPAVSGDVSLYVKLTKASGSVKFYTCTQNANGSFKKGAEYSVDMPELSESDWVKVDLPDVAEGTFLGIRGEYVGIDGFQAQNASYELKKALTIDKVVDTSVKNGNYLDANAFGKATVSFTVTITNSGDVDLNPGDEGYSLSVVNYSANGMLLGVSDINEPLAVGESADILVSASFDVTEPSYNRIDVMENLTLTQKMGAWFDIYPYASVFLLYDEAASSKIDEGASINFGVTKAGASKKFRFRNNGGAPASVTEVSLPEGYSLAATDADGAELSLPLEIKAHSYVYATIVMEAEPVGDRSGAFTVTVDGNDAVYGITGQIVDPNKAYFDFEDGEFPDGSYAESSSWTISRFPANEDLENNVYCLENGNVSDQSGFILPKMRFAGEKLVFDAAERSYYSTLNVYYSKDRLNWTLLKSISASASNEADRFTDTKVSSTWDAYAFKSFTVDNIPEGDWYVKFVSGYARVDNILGGTPILADVDLMAESKTMPVSGMVNYEYAAGLKLLNLGDDIEEGKLSAKMYMGETLIEEKDMPAVAYGESVSVDFAFTPREAGEVEMKIEITDGGDFSADFTETVDIAAESSVATVVVGTPNTDNANTPLRLNYNNSDSETIYTKDLIGLPSGTMIKSIIYKGYKSSESHKAHVTAWIENTTDGIFTEEPSDLHPTDEMTKIFDGEYTFEKKGSYSDPADMLVLDFSDTPFEYTGENLRIIVSARKIDSYKSVSFMADNTIANASASRCDDFAEPTGSLTLQSVMPVAYFLVDKEVKSVSGSVVSSVTGKAVADAQVKLVSGNVEYYGATDSEGAYSVDVFQDDKDYDMTVVAEGFDAYESEVSFADGNVTDNVVLVDKREFTVAGTVTDAKNGAGIGGVAVSLKKDGELVDSSETDGTGAFSFGGIIADAEGEWTLSFEKVGYESGAADVDFASEVDCMVTVSASLNGLSGVGAASIGGVSAYGSKGCIVVLAGEDAEVRICNAAGALLRSKKVVAGETRFDGFAAGIYLVNGVKVIVK